MASRLHGLACLIRLHSISDVSRESWLLVLPSEKRFSLITSEVTYELVIVVHTHELRTQRAVV